MQKCCLSVCLCPKRQNVSIEQAQSLLDNSRDSEIFVKKFEVQKHKPVTKFGYLQDYFKTRQIYNF